MLDSASPYRNISSTFRMGNAIFVIIMTDKNSLKSYDYLIKMYNIIKYSIDRKYFGPFLS